ncbi:hypothetical protein D1BOALGB6SA_7478 [Olavius sp. associated proteobacterium Delta 1]|nr:hypothetical protein D1BOALGB6SA_7478 [Olavius sp. associated proteobacterium Delta 1]
MIKFHTNKELSQFFSINLAKWKRWSREFLPPDPLGGLQSGYARQYNLDEAFTVFIGGHLVGNLKLTIPEARKILHDLHQWLLDHDFYFDFSGNANPKNKSVHPVQNYQIAIISTHFPDGNLTGLRYRVKAIMTSDQVDFNGMPMHQERFIESSINALDNEPAQPNAESYRVLNISVLRHTFLSYFQIIL